jgi:hypothetical protein
MLKEDTLPVVGDDDNMLGVRSPPHRRADVAPDDDGNVHPGKGGMSVNCDWTKMYVNHVPKRYKHLVKHARGSNKKSIWEMGEGDFASADVNEALSLRVDKENHGLVEPRTMMGLAEYRQALADTRRDWKEIEA